MKEIELTNEQLQQLKIIYLELISEVHRICIKNNIKYSLDGGTLLGAVRHKGIIPWDNDADIIFTRDEYEKFYRACNRDLNKEKFFLQEIRTDPHYRWRYAKLRRNKTELVRPGQEHLKCHSGVFIDIFVLDNVPDNYINRRLFYFFNYCTRKILYSEVGKKVEKNSLLKFWYSIICKIPKNTVFKMQNKVWFRTNKKKTYLVGHNGYQYSNKETKYGIPGRLFNSYIDIEFEKMVFKAIKEYDEYLRLLYGDYMTPPPVNERDFHVTISKLKLLNITIDDIKREFL